MADPLGLNAAFDALERRKACPAHRWGEPFPVDLGHGKARERWWRVCCLLCGQPSSRPTLAKLQTEVLGGEG